GTNCSTPFSKINVEPPRDSLQASVSSARLFRSSQGPGPSSVSRPKKPRSSPEGWYRATPSSSAETFPPASSGTRPPAFMTVRVGIPNLTTADPFSVAGPRMPWARSQSGENGKSLSRSALQPRTAAGLAVATWPVMAWSGLDPSTTTRPWWTCVAANSMVLSPFCSRTRTRKASSGPSPRAGSVFASSLKGSRRPSIRGIAAQGERGYARTERSVVGREVSMDGLLMAHDRESESKNQPGILSGSFWQGWSLGDCHRSLRSPGSCAWTLPAGDHDVQQAPRFPGGCRTGGRRTSRWDVRVLSRGHHGSLLGL